ncbi:MAG: hypothetical protein U0231_14380 [Nitrospiraceae bacterium]
MANVLREYVTVNRATVQGGGSTTIGDHNFLMAYVHGRMIVTWEIT